MFITKIGKIYYLFFFDENWVRCKITTKCNKKSEALGFLYRFKRDAFASRKKIKAISFSDFFSMTKGGDS
jgi:hypothetical protein